LLEELAPTHDRLLEGLAIRRRCDHAVIICVSC
jgi:hypothetical protein